MGRARICAHGYKRRNGAGRAILPGDRGQGGYDNGGNARLLDNALDGNCRSMASPSAPG